jgi:hypothetical protein
MITVVGLSTPSFFTHLQTMSPDSWSVKSAESKSFFPSLVCLNNFVRSATPPKCDNAFRTITWWYKNFI